MPRSARRTPSVKPLRSPKAGRVAVIGPGAVGGVLACSLRRSGRRVVIVARSAADASRIGRSGLRLKDVSGRSRVVRGWEATSRPAGAPPCEAVFLCVKASALPRALIAARALAGPNAPVVSLLNGFSHARPLRRAFGARAVIGACYIAARRLGPCSAWHTGGRTIELARTPGPWADEARAVLRQAGWDVRTVGSEDRLLWTKAVVNAALNPLGALTGMTNGALARSPAMRELMIASAREAVRVARAAGHPPLRTGLPGRIVRTNVPLTGQLNSMAQDIARGRPTEIEAILGPFLSEASRRGIELRYLSPLYRMVKRLEALA